MPPRCRRTAPQHHPQVCLARSTKFQHAQLTAALAARRNESVLWNDPEVVINNNTKIPKNTPQNTQGQIPQKNTQKQYWGGSVFAVTAAHTLTR